MYSFYSFDRYRVIPFRATMLHTKCILFFHSEWLNGSIHPSVGCYCCSCVLLSPFDFPILIRTIGVHTWLYKVIDKCISIVFRHFPVLHLLLSSIIRCCCLIHSIIVHNNKLIFNNRVRAHDTIFSHFVRWTRSHPYGRSNSL